MSLYVPSGKTKVKILKHSHFIEFFYESTDVRFAALVITTLKSVEIHAYAATFYRYMFGPIVKVYFLGFT